MKRLFFISALLVGLNMSAGYGCHNGYSHELAGTNGQRAICKDYTNNYGSFEPAPLNSTTSSSTISNNLQAIESMEASTKRAQHEDPSEQHIIAEASQYSCEEATRLTKAVNSAPSGASCEGFAVAVQLQSCRETLLANGVEAESLDNSYKAAVNVYISLSNGKLSMARCIK